MKFFRSGMILWGLLFLFCGGCFYIGQDNYDDILNKPLTQWTPRENLTVIMECTEHNLFDVNAPNIKVLATPYYPSVIVSSVRVWRDRHHITEQEFKASSEEIARLNAGLYIDWNNNRFVDGKGNYFRGPLQLDSLMFMIHIENRGWPYYDISDLEQRIYLVNDKNRFTRPKYVWGRKQNQFALIPENLLVMFNLRSGDHHFLEGSENMYLIVKGFDADIKLTFPLSKIR